MTDPTVPVPGPDTPTWTIDDKGVLLFGPFPPPREDQPEWNSIYEILEYEDEEALAALVADVRAARAHQRCVEIETYAAKLDEAGLLRSEYPEDMARRSCTCTDDAVCGAHRLLVRYQELWEQFRAANKAKREARAAARAHEHCGPATDTIRQARELALAVIEGRKSLATRRLANEAELALLDLLVDGGGDG